MNQTPRSTTREGKLEICLLCALLGATAGTAMMLQLQWQLPISHASRMAAAVSSVAISLFLARKTAGLGVTNRVNFVVDPQGVAKDVSKGHTRALVAWLFWPATGAACALAAWWFVPTTDGINLWSARHEQTRVLDELTALPAGDIPGYLSGQLARKLVAEFPSCRQQVLMAEGDWIERSVTRWKQDGDFAEYIAFKREREKLPLNSKVAESLREVEDAWVERTFQKLRDDYAHLPAADFRAFEALRAAYAPARTLNDGQVQRAQDAWTKRTVTKLKSDLSGLPEGDFSGFQALKNSYRSLQDNFLAAQLFPAEEAWAKRTAGLVIYENKPLWDTNHAEASARLQQVGQQLADLGDYPAAQRDLKAARKDILRARLHAAQRRAIELVRQDRFQKAAELAKHLHDELSEEAREVDAEKELIKFREGYSFLAELAQRAGVSDPE